jgi:hypothetical protein
MEEAAPNCSRRMILALKRFLSPLHQETPETVSFLILLKYRVLITDLLYADSTLSSWSSFQNPRTFQLRRTRPGIPGSTWPPLSYRVPILSRFGNNQLIGLFPLLLFSWCQPVAARTRCCGGGHRRGRCCDRSLPPQTMTEQTESQNRRKTQPTTTTQK